jgi:hypothetical protein
MQLSRSFVLSHGWPPFGFPRAAWQASSFTLEIPDATCGCPNAGTDRFSFLNKTMWEYGASVPGSSSTHADEYIAILLSGGLKGTRSPTTIGDTMRIASAISNVSCTPPEIEKSAHSATQAGPGGMALMGPVPGGPGPGGPMLPMSCPNRSTDQPVDGLFIGEGPGLCMANLPRCHAGVGGRAAVCGARAARARLPTNTQRQPPPAPA